MFTRWHEEESRGRLRRRERAGRDDVYSMYEMHLETLAGNGTPSATARIAARLLLGTEALAR